VSQTETLNAADTALDFALQQVGKPYQWGAVGPNSYDCSGLTQTAYSKAGVKIPRTSSTQAVFGKAIAYKDVAPGDLIFPYFPVTHVAMYAGNGMVVEAPEPGKNVHVVKYYGSTGGIRRVTDQPGTHGTAAGAPSDNSGASQNRSSFLSLFKTLVDVATNVNDWISIAYIIVGSSILIALIAPLIADGIQGADKVINNG
jgi:hypothetical protein